jgi:hypothetical protein
MNMWKDWEDTVKTTNLLDASWNTGRIPNTQCFQDFHKDGKHFKEGDWTADQQLWGMRMGNLQKWESPKKEKREKEGVINVSRSQEGQTIN